MPMASPMLAAEVTYEALAKGARLTFKAKDPAKLDDFRKQMESHAEMIKKGDCSMMGTMMQNSQEPHHQ